MNESEGVENHVSFFFWDHKVCEYDRCVILTNELGLSEGLADGALLG